MHEVTTPLGGGALKVKEDQTDPECEEGSSRVLSVRQHDCISFLSLATTASPCFSAFSTFSSWRPNYVFIMHILTAFSLLPTGPDSLSFAFIYSGVVQFLFAVSSLHFHDFPFS